MWGSIPWTRGRCESPGTQSHSRFSSHVSRTRVIAGQSWLTVSSGSRRSDDAGQRLRAPGGMPESHVNVGTMYSPPMVTIRPATASDETILGRFGGALMRQHHAADPRRFIQVDNPEAGYGRYLVSQLSNPSSLVLVAERSGTVVGYVYA